MTDSFGKLFNITVFGESHGEGVGVVIDGCPAGLPLAAQDIQDEVDKRKPGNVAGGTSRVEQDRVEIFSGVFENHTTGAPVCLTVRNRDADSGAYAKNRFLPRPGHADYTAYIKYGGFNDYRGGGMFSGRITVALVMAGAVAKKLLHTIGMEVLAHTAVIGGVRAEPVPVDKIRDNAAKNSLHCADLAAAARMAEAIEKARQEGDSLGGVVEGIALGVPAGLGEPFFDNLDGELAKALFAIPAVKGVEFGAGFGVAGMKGSQNNDSFMMQNGKVVTATNHAGGILGGISSGMPVILRVAIKPTPSIARRQATVDINSMQNASLEVSGRHDVCIVPRAVVVIEAVMAITLCDFALRAGLIKRVL